VCEVRLREEEHKIAYFTSRHPRLTSLTWGARGEGGWGNDDGGGDVERDV
jgi:hypothetical protein